MGSTPNCKHLNRALRPLLPKSPSRTPVCARERRSRLLDRVLQSQLPVERLLHANRDLLLQSTNLVGHLPHEPRASEDRSEVVNRSLVGLTGCNDSVDRLHGGVDCQIVRVSTW